MKPNFQVMTLQELQKYVLAHREDPGAFQASVERIGDRPPDRVHGEISPEEFSALLTQQDRPRRES